MARLAVCATFEQDLMHSRPCAAGTTATRCDVDTMMKHVPKTITTSNKRTIKHTIQQCSGAGFRVVYNAIAQATRVARLLHALEEEMHPRCPGSKDIVLFVTPCTNR